eukprot:1153936-Rhodomonas_salina.1
MCAFTHAPESLLDRAAGLLDRPPEQAPDVDRPDDLGDQVVEGVVDLGRVPEQHIHVHDRLLDLPTPAVSAHERTWEASHGKHGKRA